MAELHEALKYLGPAEWSSIPTEGEELKSYLTDLFAKSQLVVDSIPIPAPEDAPQKPEARARGHAENASEVTLSSERPPPPPFGHEKFQKEWGKPMKIKASDNPLGLSVYKMASKDGRGTWFGRRSIHEGIGFARFKRSLEIEFDKSLAEPGPPGSGNVRGIGGEERVEQIKTELGTVEVYRLSAQFPGPTAARDFVTMLVTSDKAMHVENETKDHFAPRHYMIISRPCNHPKTQPRSGFVRGFYESVEFIREVPRRLRSSQSTRDLASQKKHHDKHYHHHHRPRPQHSHTDTLPIDSKIAESHGRQRAVTVDQPTAEFAAGKPDPTDPEDNPVEWIMITRSDPGGGIPRFLVERGTPGSICADAVKFVDWACQNDEDAEIPTAQEKLMPHRRGSHQSWRSRSLVGIDENEREEYEQEAQSQTPVEQHEQNGLLGAVTGAAATLRPYTPQIVLDRLPKGLSEQDEETDSINHGSSKTLLADQYNDDARSSMSETSFASAEDHWSSEPEDGEADSLNSQGSINPITGSRDNLHQEKELRRLDDRRQALHKKFAETQAKYDEARKKQAETNAQQTQKALDKHERDLKKHEEKFQKELAKIERKQEQERKKAIEKAKKQADKDEQAKLKRERDEARQELDLVKKEVESLRQIVADLQKENTSLVMKLGKAGLLNDADGTRSRGSSMSRKTKDLATASAAASLKSDRSRQSMHS